MTTPAAPPMNKIDRGNVSPQYRCSCKKALKRRLSELTMYKYNIDKG